MTDELYVPLERIFQALTLESALSKKVFEKAPTKSFNLNVMLRIMINYSYAVIQTRIHKVLQLFGGSEACALYIHILLEAAKSYGLTHKDSLKSNCFNAPSLFGYKLITTIIANEEQGQPDSVYQVTSH